MTQLVIRKMQFTALEATLGVSIFETTSTEHLRRIHADRFQLTSDEELLAFVRRMRAQCRGIGIDEFTDCAVVLELAVEFGEDFLEAQPWATAASGSPEWLQPQGRAELLLNAAASYLDDSAARDDAADAAALMDEELADGQEEVVEEDEEPEPELVFEDFLDLDDEDESS
jgi:hypothetical protein